MAIITESGDLSVGVRILDCDHREMADAIRELHAAAMADQDRSLTGPLLRRLAHFTMTHFALEEGMMGATKYPERAAHRLNHQRMIVELKAMAARHSRGQLALTPDALSILSEWHLEHVQRDDLRYGSWLNQTTRV
ncbi:MAG: bacteriohemerythrin [Terracidiphilus sp.]|jgi:hemerythrin